MKKNLATLLLILFFLTLSFSKLKAVEYTTIASGNWTTAGTWQNGSIPGHTIASGDIVNINHAVIYTRPNDLLVSGTINMTNSLLQFPTTGNGSGRSITIFSSGTLVITNSTFIMPIQDGSGNDLSGNFVLDGGRLIVNEGSMDIAQNWESKNGARATLQNSCMRIGQSHLLTSGTIDTCINFNLEAGVHGSGNFELSGNSIARMANTKLLLTGSGNFKVNGGSSLTGISGVAIGLYGLKVTGNLDNDGTWSAVVQDHCLDGPIGGSNAGQITTHLANTENCTYVNSMADGLCAILESPLSLNLISFQGNLNRYNRATLHWTVDGNELIKRFEIERSFNAKDFTTIASIPASGKTGIEKYMHYDTITTNDKVMYRLKLFNNQTHFDHSRMLVFTTTATKNHELKIMGNPTTDKLNFSLTASGTQVIQVNIFDLNGKLVMNKRLNILEGTNIVSLKLNPAIKTGMYLLEINGGVMRKVSKFIKH